MKSHSARPKKIAVVGTGPGGIAAAAILAHRGFEVEVFEKSARIGGRSGCLEVEGYKFDIGPTFLMMKFLLDGIFRECGEDSGDHLRFQRLDPMYELRFADRSFRPSDDPARTKAEIERVFPGASRGFDAFMAAEKKRFEHIIPCLQRDYSSMRKLVSPVLLRSLPYLSLGKSVFEVLRGYFGRDDLALLFSFQSKYLGMSAWDCPGGFSMLSYIEYAFGIYHTEGGLARIPAALAGIARQRGAKIHLGRAVSRLILDGREVRGLELADGEKVAADAVVMNADFAQAMTSLVEPGVLRKYSRERLERKKFSCSTYMLHLGLDRRYPGEHHTIHFARDYRRNVEEIFNLGRLSDDVSFYVRNASPLDPTLAPPGHSSVYVLVPVPNLDADIDWEERRAGFRELVLRQLEERMGWAGVREHIVVERSMDPAGWRTDLDVFKGATFNLSHNLSQMAYWRPRNRFEELGNLYLTGGGTHPGSGLPTILESARISSNLISSRFGIDYRTTEVRP